VVRDDDRDAELAADAEGLVERLHHLVRLVAHVRDVEALARRERPADLDDLLGARLERRRIEGPVGEADRAGVERLDEERAHLRDLLRRRLAVEVSMAAARSVEWPTSAATLVAAGAASSAFTHDAKVSWRSTAGRR
jgi:hypothetical protein